MSTTYEQILYEVCDRILTITLNRPERLNAYTSTMSRELNAALSRANEDDEVRAVIVTGAGRGFCAGADLERGSDTFVDRTSEQARSGQIKPDSGGVLSLTVYDLKKPIVAAVNGPAVGVGATMTLPMDLRLASERAKFGFVFTRRGIVPEACSSWFLPRLVGPAQAADWVLTGRVFSAQEALAGGLVSRVLSEDELLPAARAWASEVAQNTSAVSVALARQMMWKGLGMTHPREAHDIESQGIHWMGRSPDCAEGVTSFLEKRPPKFPMRASQDMPPYFPWWNATET
jgi:enoyl-CoA hydratase/carnithine racemase